MIFSLLPKRSNSNCEKRKKTLERFIRLFGPDCIDCLVADREFIGKEWIGWFNDRRIRYYIRIRQNFRIIKPSTGERIRAWWLFNDLRVGQEKFLHKLFLHKGEYVYIAGSRIMERIARRVAMVCMAPVWTYLVGEHKDVNVKPIRILKHGRKAKSLVKYGLEEISSILLRPIYIPKFDIFKFLSCT